MLDDILCFSLEEIDLLFESLTSLWNFLDINPNKRPLRGFFALMLKIFILKSRSNINTSNINKFITDEAAINIVNNPEIWMQKVEFLNDKREGKTIKEIFINKQWMDLEWTKKISIDFQKNEFVTSFSKNKPNIGMEKKYGQNMFGYKTDKIAFILAPYYKFGPLEIMMEEVFFYDITYDKNVIKKEINLVSKIINRINIETSDKIELANNVLKYWALTIKDAKWKEEKERRYQLSIYSSHDYYNVEVNDRF